MNESQTTDANSQSGKDPAWEQTLITELASAALVEQRKQRRWNIFFKSAFLAYLFIFVIIFFNGSDDGSDEENGEHTAVIDIQGIIAAGESASAENIIPGLQRAFENEDTQAVMLRINSPGGSPVQAGMVYDEIKRLRDIYPETLVYAVITDVCASGGYYIAAAADKIYADKASVVGSIGVRMDSFGFVGAMKKLGVERRLLTAGESKGLLDPFLPSEKAEVKHIQGLLDNIHQQFIAVVKEGRGDRLVQSDDLFSGLIWTGEQGVAKGLLDGLGAPEQVARDVIGVERMVSFNPRKDYFERLAERLGTQIANQLNTRLDAGWQLR